VNFYIVILSYLKYQMKDQKVKFDIGSNEIRQDKQNMRIVL